VEAILGAGLLAAACARPGLDPAALPTAPLAIVHRSYRESDERAELLEKRGPSVPGVVRLEDVGLWLGVGADPEERKLGLLGHLALLDARTGRIERVAAALSGARPQCWSADHERLLFANLPADGIPQLFEYRPDGGELRAVTRGPAAHPFGCYGPGTSVVVARVELAAGGAVSRLWVLEPGREPRRLSDGPVDRKPVWSPRGSPIAYETNGPEGVSVVAALDPAGGPSRVLARGRDPAFTPDGAWIVYSAQARGRWRLWRMRPDGSGKLRIGESRFDEHDPAVAPDGRTLAFVGEEPGSARQQLLVRNLTGGAERPLIEHEEGSSPAW
jgi:hypothetical protein